MASGDERATPPENLTGQGLRIGLVYARWNRVIIDRLLGGADRVLAQYEVDHVERHSVPGSFELPMGAKLLIDRALVDAVVVVGVVIRGETTHYELVSEGVATGVQRLQVDSGIPVTLGVVTVENEAQALARSEGEGGHNVGAEATLAAIEMAHLARTLG